MGWVMVGPWWVHWRGHRYAVDRTVSTSWTVLSVRRGPYHRYAADRTMSTQRTVPRTLTVGTQGPYRGGAYRAYQDCDWIQYVV